MGLAWKQASDYWKIIILVGVHVLYVISLSYMLIKKLWTSCSLNR